MEKINIGVQGFTLPMPQTILGCRQDGRNNFMALAWTSRVNYNPSLMMISVGKKHFSNSAIKATGEFSVNIPSIEMLEITDFVGLVSGSKLDKSDLFEVHKGELENAPVIANCPVGMECKVFDSIELPNDTLFVGEVIATWCNDDVLTEGIPDIKKVNPFTLTMPDNRYWSVGECVGKAWHDGKKLK
ncbi:NADH-FMN oxidoreductase RutF, flavin reductase (DIM6/NTAB) family [Maridesulfovibrio ferrireducens]|uniref:NADH-FMN oxidoreductase RutF, flavin reductase (DIM6/NTAB) family n=1 Tax=Maridesulfovibrio ferrireducens TaxID=246191 RepID=A0A1G9FQ87_9BACT|nr:flavin reductase family protein [Maridesulfovibrio ferrireducens]SDK90527.1 NADH-FMN oxidoreductase RutF, flavin reductase (DIM6/NTAB) family [Maridesulfovibrio ferrireducens]